MQKNSKSTEKVPNFILRHHASALVGYGIGLCPIPINTFYPGQQEYQGQAAAALFCQVPFYSATFHVTRSPVLMQSSTQVSDMAPVPYKSANLVRAEHSLTSPALCNEKMVFPEHIGF